MILELKHRVLKVLSIGYLMHKLKMFVRKKGKQISRK